MLHKLVSKRSGAAAITSPMEMCPGLRLELDSNPLDASSMHLRFHPSKGWSLQ
jgi:hypothetical protein